MLTIAHRGCAEQYPENTLRAIRESASRVDLIEVDVRRCATGELVLFHDEGLERITGAEGTVRETPWDELAELEVLESGERIPRLDEAVSRWPASTGVNLDLLHPGIGGDALALTSGFDLDVLVSTTHRSVVEECRSRDRSATVGLSFVEDHEERLRSARESGCDYVHVPARLCIDTDLVRRAHDLGLRVDAWTVDEESTIESLRSVGVDAVTVDRCDIV